MLTIERVSASLALLTIDRPPANALTDDLIRTLTDRFAGFDGENDAPAIILTGAGERFFCAGGDIREITTNQALGVPRIRALHRLLVTIENYRRPVLCAVNGYAVGAGLELALHADHVVASENARFGFPEINHGLLPAAKGIRQAANRLGRRVAEQLLYSGDLISAERALAIGLVDEVVGRDELQARVRARAKEMCSKDMHLFSAIKRTFADVALMSDAELEERTVDDMLDYLDRDDAAAARERFLQRKAIRNDG